MTVRLRFGASISRRRFRRASTFAAAVVIGVAGCHAPVRAQTVDEDRGSDPAGRLVLPAHHWMVDALRRLDAFAEGGSGGAWGFRTPSRRDVLELRALSRTDPTNPIHDLADAYLERFLEEVGGAAGAHAESFTGSDSGGWLRWAGGSVDVRMGDGSEVLGTGAGGQGGVERVPPASLGTPDFPTGSITGAGVIGPVGIVAAAYPGEVGRLGVEELYATTGIGSVNFWAGRRAPGIGGSVGGTIALSGRVPINGGGLALARPITLPWFFRHLGPTRVETHVARFRENGQVERPFFWAARGSIAPHPRIGIAINRAAILGGDPAPRITLIDIITEFFAVRRSSADQGFPRSAFANQIGAVELRYRLLTGDAPTSVYLEWGMEDSAGAWKNVPGIIAGVHLAALPGVPGVSVGIERTHFSPQCCRNPRWYRHHQFTGGWADGGIPLGHPLGGHGDEWLLHGRVDLHEARLRSSWRLFHRNRGFENLYTPDREGRSIGFGIEARYRLTPHLELFGEGRHERGTDAERWRYGAGFVGIRAFF